MNESTCWKFVCQRCRANALKLLESKDVIWCPLCGWELTGEYAVLRWGKALVVVAMDDEPLQE